MQIECKHIDLSDLPSCGVYCVPCSLWLYNICACLVGLYIRCVFCCY